MSRLFSRVLAPVLIAVSVNSTPAFVATAAAGGVGTCHLIACPPKLSAVTLPVVKQPDDPGGGQPVLILGSNPRPADFDYEVDEVFFQGTAQAYTSSTPLTADGKWNVTPDTSALGTAPYTSRMIIHKPKNPAKFNGTVYVEWLNVSNLLDYAAVFQHGGIEVMRSGAIWVGISAQRAGIEAGPIGTGLKGLDPARYAELSHPGDDFSYDIFSQAGAAIWFDSDVLDGLRPKRLIAMGESQSALYLGTYVNAIAPLSHVFNGYIQHTRGAAVAPLSTPPRALLFPPATGVRTDLKDRVLMFVSEMEVLGAGLLGSYSLVRQPDTNYFRAWEVAGMSHVDAYSGVIEAAPDASSLDPDRQFFAMMRNPPSTVFSTTCPAPVNTGPHTYVLRSALQKMDWWVRTGIPPRSQQPLQLIAGTTDPVRDQLGNVLGGVRTPHVDVPVATLTSTGQTGGSCALFGTTTPFDEPTLNALYPTHQTFVRKWKLSLAKAVLEGSLTPLDALALGIVANESSIGN